MRILPIILAGGSGNRLWPLSAKKPKQFLNLVEDETLFTRACKLVADEEVFERPIVISNKNYINFIEGEQQQIGAIISEPKSRNTAPAIAAAAHYAKKKFGSEIILLVLPSDQVIKNFQPVIDAVRQAKKLAVAGNIITFGVVPSSAETAYGYIQKSEQGAEVIRFTEKPDAEKAKEFLENKNYFWNSGIFLFQAKAYLAELKQFEPEIYDNTKTALQNSSQKNDVITLEEKSFAACKKISIDYAVLEKSGKIKMAELPKDAGWNDIGSFNFLYAQIDKDDNGNSIKGSVFAENSENCYLHSDSGKMVAVGLKNIVAVQVDGVTLIMDKNESQNLQSVVDRMKKNG